MARRATELAPKQGEVLDTLGWVYFQKGMYSEATETLKEAATILPQHATIRFHLGMAHSKQGRKSDAAAELRRALLINPNFPEAGRARDLLATLGG